MSTTTSMSPAEDLDTVSSDTSYENRKYRQHQRRPTPSQNISRSHSFSTIPRSPGDTLSYASASQTANGEFFVPTARPGSAYSAEMPVPSSYSVWGSDSSQHLYRKQQSDKRKACNTLLIATTTLVFLAVLAIAAVAAYLGVMTRNSDGDKYEIGFEGSLRIVHGDNYSAKLQDRFSVEHHRMVEKYLRKIDTVYRKSPLGDSFRRCTVENFTNGSLIVQFILYFDRRKFPVQVGETEASVRDVLVQEVMAVEPVAFKDVTIDIDSIQLKRHKKERPDTKSSRLQKTDVDMPEPNSVELELIHNLDVDDDVDETLFSTTSTTAAPPTSSSTARTTTSRATTTPLTTTTSTKATTTTTTTEEPTSTQTTLKVEFDRTPWRPVSVADVVLPEELIPELENRFLPGVLKQPVFDIEPVSESELNPQHESNFIRRVGIVVQEDPAGPDTDTQVQNPVPVMDDMKEEEKEQGEMADKRVDEEELDEEEDEEDYDYSEEGSTVAPAVPQVTTTELSVEVTTKKFSFLDWLSAQVANQKNSTALPNNQSGKTFTTTKPATRFFTFTEKSRPSVTSHSAVQPIPRPKPPPSNFTTPAPPAETSPSSLAPENPTTFVPKPFQIQAVFSVMSERTRTLSESPRSQKSLDDVAEASPSSRTVASAVEMPALPDHFPPVRKPTSRPSNFKPINDTAVSNLPIENLFTTAKPKNQSKTNSPVYTFKLGQGQSFHEVLSKVLADLAVGENPSSLKIDGTEMETSTKNPNLKPWTNLPFRPAVLNNLFLNKNRTAAGTGNAVGTSSNENDIVRIEANQVSTTTTTTTSSPVGLACNETTQFRCSNGDCISALSRCNQMRDCADNSDEVNCTCADFLHAQFLNRKICDGVVDCWDYSDENQCEWCSPEKYICTSSKKCINQTQVCDGIRDCPAGDDERNCVTIASDEESADKSTYSNAGYVMVRREGRWGKLCMENFEPAMKKLRDNYEVADLGKAVCSALTFNELDRIDRRVDTAPLGRSSAESFYYEIMESVINNDNINMETARSSTIEYTPAKCSSKDVVHVTCKNLSCGIRPRLSVSRARIVGGGNATPGAWPWQAALYKDGDFQCGATLINDRWLVSAGHCFYHSLDDYWVARLGALRRGSNLLSPFEQVRPVTHIFIHPNYVDAGFVNDISLLRMEEPVTFTDYVRPVCLPPPDTEIKDGRYCTVVGWGQLYETGRVFPDTLQEVQLPLVSTDECRKRTLFLPLYRLTNNMFCAGFDRGGRDACLGDSGGPLMCQEADSKWSIYGVTSNGYGCARANRPGVYTKVSQYVNWINSVVNGTYPQPKRKSPCNGHRCLLGECLPKSHVCNRIAECSDGSDERDCA